MTDRDLPLERGAVAERPDAGGGASTPSYARPDDAVGRHARRSGSDAGRSA